MKIIWKNLCEQHLQTNCLKTQLTNPDLRLFEIPEKEQIYKILTQTDFHGVYPEAQMLLKEALIENSLVNLFIEISEDCVKKENFEYVWLEQYKHYKRRHSLITFLYWTNDVLKYSPLSCSIFHKLIEYSICLHLVIKCYLISIEIISKHSEFSVISMNIILIKVREK